MKGKNRPIIVFIGGAEGSGKTTLVTLLGKKDVGKHITFSKYVREIDPEFDDKYEPYSTEALKVEDKIRKKLLKELNDLDTDEIIFIDAHYGYLIPDAPGKFRYQQVIEDKEAEYIDIFAVVDAPAEELYKRRLPREADYFRKFNIKPEHLEIERENEVRVAEELSRKYDKIFVYIRTTKEQYL